MEAFGRFRGMGLAARRVVVEALRAGAEITAPFHRGRRGHPVGFCKTCRERLLALEGYRRGYDNRPAVAQAAARLAPMPVSC